MALSDLISRLEQEAQGRVEAIAHAADDAVRSLEAETERAVREITTRHLERGCAERQVVHDRELVRAGQQARARELEAMHTQLARVLTRARELLPEAAASTSYLEALPSHLDEALLFLDGLQPRVRCQAAFASVLQPGIARHGQAQLVIDESVGPGLVADASDGSVTVDNTFVARLGRAERRLVIELARKLRGSPLPAEET